MVQYQWCGDHNQVTPDQHGWLAGGPVPMSQRANEQAAAIANTQLVNPR